MCLKVVCSADPIIPLKSEFFFRVLTIRRSKLLKTLFVFNSKLSMGWGLKLPGTFLLSKEGDMDMGSHLPV